MDIFLSILAGAFLGYVIYRLIVVLYYAIKAGIRQANYLEREFGADFTAAARYQFTGKDPRNG